MTGNSEVGTKHDWKQLATDTAGGGVGDPSLEGSTESLQGQADFGNQSGGTPEVGSGSMDVNGSQAVSSEPSDSTGSLPEMRYHNTGASASTDRAGVKRRATLLEQIDYRFTIDKGQCRATNAIETVTRHLRAAAISMVCSMDDCREVAIAITKLEEAGLWFAMVMRRRGKE